jgi:FkbM family methyltransferase
MSKWLDAKTLATDGYVLRVDAGDTLGLGRSGGYEPFETRILESLIGEGSTVIDAGANAGWYTVRFARAAGPAGRVFAFEPLPRTARLLEHNLHINGIRNVTVVPQALAEASGPRRLFLSPTNQGDHRLHDAGHERETIDIEAVTLDDWLGDHAGTISLIKLDIQGAEVQALDGMRRTLARHPETWLATEFWPIGLRQAGSSAREYLDRLRALGGAIFRIDERRSDLVRLDEKWLATAVTEARGNHTNLLVVPRGWPELHDWPISARFHKVTPDMAQSTIRATSPLRVLLSSPPSNSSLPAVHVSVDAPSLRDALAAVRVDAVLASNEPLAAGAHDLIHVIGGGEPADVERRLTHARASGLPVVFSPLVSEAGDERWNASLRTQIALADRLVVFSEHELAVLHEAGALTAPYSLVHHAVDPVWAEGATGEAFASRFGERAYALCVAADRRCVETLARAIGDTDLDLVAIVGSGDAGAAPSAGEAARIGEPGGGRVQVVSGLRHDDPLLASVYAGARVFVDAGDDAAFAAVSRAAAVGLPLILSDRSGTREYFGPLASYFDTSDIDTLRDLLRAAAAADTDAGREGRRNEARAWIGRALTWEHAARETAQAYARALEGRTSGSPGFTAPAPRKLEIGSGMTPQRGYEHLDARADLPDIDHVADTRQALPFPDGAFDALLSRSCIEHVSWREVQSVVREWGRIVKPGGTIDIWTPDFEYLCRRYLARKDDRHLDPALVAEAGAFLGGYDDPAWAIIKMFGGQDYPENFHGAVLDEEVLTRVLEGAGFEQVERHEPYWGLHLIARRAPAFARQAGVRGTAERAPRPEPSSPSLVWDGPIFNLGGYASLARHVIRALVPDGVSVQLTTRDDDEQIRQASMTSREAWLWKRALRRRGRPGVHVSCYTPADWQGASVFDERRKAHPGFQAYVGLSMFETDRLPDGWAAACAALDEVWVPSRHSRDLFEQAGVPGHKLQVLPVGIDAERYDPARIEPLPIPGRRGFMFLSVFDWTLRKGWDALIEAYARAFRASDDVCLVLRTASRSPKERPAVAIEALFDRLGIAPAERPTLILLEAPIPEDDMPRLYRAADAFVLPTRGEGWGLPLMEAMASGLPTIATGWGGHLDFMNDGNSWLIDVDGLVPVATEQARRSPFYAGGHRWAQPSVTHTATLMRRAFDDRAAGRRLGELAREAVRTSWARQRTSAWIVERLGRLAADPAAAMEKAKIAEAEGRVEEALALYAQAASRPGWHLPRYNRASLLKRMHRRGEAEQSFRDIASQDDPSLQAGARFHLGELAFLAGRIEDARDQFTACLELQPQHGSARAWLAFVAGRLCERANDLAGAAAAYGDACTRKPDWMLAAYNLASVCRRLGQVERAQNLFATVTRLSEDPALRGGSHFHLAEIHDAAGRLGDAVNHIDACVRHLPRHTRAEALRESLLTRQR